MATHDWNNDGKNDMIDNYIEYQIYKDVTGQNDEPSYTPSRGNGMSTFGAIISVIAGLVEYYGAATPQIRQSGNRLSGLAETACASLLA